MKILTLTLQRCLYLLKYNITLTILRILLTSNTRGEDRGWRCLLFGKWTTEWAAVKSCPASHRPSYFADHQVLPQPLKYWLLESGHIGADTTHGTVPGFHQLQFCWALADFIWETGINEVKRLKLWIVPKQAGKVPAGYDCLSRPLWCSPTFHFPR